MALRLSFLRPYTSPVAATSTTARCSAYLRFYELAHEQAQAGCRGPRRGARTYATRVLEEGEPTPVQDNAMRTRRINELRKAGGLEYPRFNFQGKPTSTRQFRTDFEHISKNEVEYAHQSKEQEIFCIHGRVLNVRRHGARFSFVLIINDGVPLQVMLNYNKIADTHVSETAFKEFNTLLQRGDHISVSGLPALSSSGELCIEARALPKLFSPCLVPLPEKISPDTAIQNRHMDLLVNRSSRDTLLLRDFIIRHVRAHLHKVLGCVEVQTPILAANAGGAIARAFETDATEFPHKDLSLRIAPELWLKRLVVAGIDRVYELGPSFRNEGVDATHNPEFTTCEFYLAHTNLSALMNITCTLFYGLAKSINQRKSDKFASLPIPEGFDFSDRIERVDFIPAINKALGRALPDLESPTALPDLLALLNETGKDWHRSLPPNPSLPKLLDHIAAAVIEPQSKGRALFITHHPVCMSPLAKSFARHGQQVSARAELFCDGREIANMYEEENDPFKQRAKFIAQAKARLALLRGGAVAMDDAPAHVIDEQYLTVLEAGLPPTGGWGCGIDRLVMLFSGAKRISDVQPFGNLRHVVGLGAVRSALSQGEDFEGVDAARAKVRETRAAALRARRAMARKEESEALKEESEALSDAELREVFSEAKD